MTRMTTAANSIAAPPTTIPARISPEGLRIPLKAAFVGVKGRDWIARALAESVLPRDAAIPRQGSIRVRLCVSATDSVRIDRRLYVALATMAFVLIVPGCTYRHGSILDQVKADYAEVDAITDDKQLAAIAEKPSTGSTDPDVFRREAAAAKLTDQSVLARVATSDRQKSVRKAALTHLVDQDAILRVATLDRNASVREAAILRLTDQQALAEIAINANEVETDVSEMSPGPPTNLAWYAVSHLSDQALLAKVAIEAPAKITAKKVDAAGAGAPANGFLGLGGEVWAITRSADRWSVTTSTGTYSNLSAATPEIVFGTGFIANERAIRRLTDRNLLAKVKAESKQPSVRASVDLRLSELPAQENAMVKAQGGDVRAQLELGDRYSHGRGMDQDEAEAVKWYRKAAEQKCAPAEEALGYAYLFGGGVPRDLAEALNWYRRAAEHDYAPAQFQLGLAYDGEWLWKKGALPVNEAEAFKWYLRAAEQNFAQAQRKLDRFYARGDVAPKDLSEAYKWRLLAAAQYNNTAGLYFDGKQLSQDLIVEGRARADRFQPQRRGDTSWEGRGNRLNWTQKP